MYRFNPEKFMQLIRLPSGNMRAYSRSCSSGILSALLKDLDDQVGIDNTDHMSGVCDSSHPTDQISDS